MGLGKKKKSTIILAVIAVAVIACIIFLIENPWFFKLEYETTDKTNYSKCLRLVDDMSGVTECFPKKIPANARDAAFKAYNNFGGRALTLSFIADDSEIQACIDKAKATALCFGTKDNSQVAEALPSYIFSSLSNDDSVYVLCSEPYKPNDFNHAKLAWVVVNEKTHSITYTAESY